MSLLSSVRKPFRYTFSNATLIIILVNVLLYFLLRYTPFAVNYKLLALSVPGLFGYHWWWQPFTYMFVHANLSHLFFNMLALLFFGIPTEKALGSKEFVLMYGVCGILCGLVSAVFYLFVGWGGFLVGASGAIYAMLLAYAVIFPRSRIFIWGILPVPAPILVIIYALIELGNQLFSLNSGVAHLTHLAGFAFAWLYFRVRMGIKPLQIWKDAYR